MLTIDASVWVSAALQNEKFSARSAAYLRRVAEAQTHVIVPTLVVVEVAAALRRMTGDVLASRDLARKFFSSPFVSMIPLDAALATNAADLAVERAVRGADAVYAAVAVAHACELVTLDREQADRLSGAVRVRNLLSDDPLRP